MNLKNNLKENKEYLETILPHKKPMVLIDDVVDYDFEKGWLKSIVSINENSLFFDKTIQGVSGVVGIEYMAQTIGCYAFLKNKLTKPKIGFLLGTRSYNCEIEKFLLNESYVIEVKETFSSDEMQSFECLIYNNTKEVVEALINVYQPNNEMNLELF